MNRTWIKLSAALLALVFLAGCRTYPDEVGSFRFPILSGDLYFAKTYGDLVTSIINPDHVLSDNYLEQLPQ